MTSIPEPELGARFDVVAARKEFPILAKSVRSKRLAYLDNAATTQKPRMVIERIRRFYEEENANVHRGVHYLSEIASAEYEEVRSKIARFLKASDAHEIVFTRGTTESINLVARGFVMPRIKPGQKILITGIEHHANIVPWQMVCEETGASLLVAQVDDDGVVDLEEFARLLRSDVAFASVTYASNAIGIVNPIQEMCRLASSAGVPILVDGAQAVPHYPVDLATLGCDFFAFSAHKAFGPTGAGALYGKASRLAEMGPLLGGGDMIRSVTFEKTTFAEPPFRFEAGTPNIEGVIAMGAAIDYMAALDWSAVHGWESALLREATHALREISGLKIYGDVAKKAPILSFNIQGVHAHDVGTILDMQGVAVRAGHHCAQPLMHRLGVAGTVRASFSFYNDLEDVAQLHAAVLKVKEVFGP
ncbi:MAG: Cysteine desulfurase [Fimbriimonadales bacterium]|nr:Cysteine desulfurase [Fimbriimonadales bacterium]